MGTVQKNPITMPVAEAELAGEPTANTVVLDEEVRSEAVSARRAALVATSVLMMLGAFVAYGSAAVASADVPNSYNSQDCPGDSSKQCIGTQAACPGDTRGPVHEVVCDHDATHRVCAKIGDPDTSFWEYTGQTNWCDQDLYSNRNGQAGTLSCQPDRTWCICKWATARWIAGVWTTWNQQGSTCPPSIEINCAATDICVTHQGLYFSYSDYGVQLGPAHHCVKQKCSAEWTACDNAQPNFNHGDITDNSCQDAGGGTFTHGETTHSVSSHGTTAECQCKTQSACQNDSNCDWTAGSPGTCALCASSGACSGT